MKIVDILSAYINKLVFIYKPSLSGDLNRKKGQTKYKSSSEDCSKKTFEKRILGFRGGEKNKNHNFWNFTIQYTVNAAALLHTALPSLIESSSLLATRLQIWVLPMLKYIQCWKDLLPVHFSQQEIKYITDTYCGCTPSQKNHYPEQPPSTHPECFNTGILTVKLQINRM